MIISTANKWDVTKACCLSLVALALVLGAGPAYAQQGGFNSTMGDVPFSANGTPVFTIHNGITNTSPTPNPSVSFNGNIGIGIGTAVPGSSLQVNGNTAIGYSTSTAAPTNGLTVSGFVGIGTTAPDTALTVDVPTNTYGTAVGNGIHVHTGNMNAGVSTQNTGGDIKIGGNGDFSFDGGTDYVFDFTNVGGISGSTDFVWAGDPSSPRVNMTITNTGNVGIGTSTPPNYPLVVVGPSATLGQGGQVVMGTANTWWAVDSFDGQINWLTGYGSGTAASAIGTLDNEPLYFSTNSIWAGGFSANGDFVVGCSMGETLNNYATYSRTTGTPGGCQSGGAGSNLIVEGSARVTGSVYAGATLLSSDQRLKMDIHPINNSLDKLLALHGVEFSWKNGGRPDMGVVAQDVQKVFPNIVSTGGSKDGMLAVEYNALIGPTIEAIRQLKTENDALSAHLAKLDAEMQVLKQENARLNNVKATRHEPVVPAATVEQ